MNTKNTIKQLAEMREQIAELQAERTEVQSALVPRDEALSLLERTIGHYSALAPHHPEALLRPGASPTELFMILKASPNDFASYFCSIVPDLVRSRFTEAIDELLEQRPPGLPVDERPAAIAKLDAAIRELELTEESLIADAGDAGIELDRRGDADPAVVLDVVMDGEPFTPPQKRNRPKTKRSKRRWSEALDKDLNPIPKQTTTPTRI